MATRYLVFCLHRPRTQAKDVSTLLGLSEQNEEYIKHRCLLLLSI